MDIVYDAQKLIGKFEFWIWLRFPQSKQVKAFGY